jgi:hypothetical protein
MMILGDIFAKKIMSGHRITAYYSVHIYYQKAYFERGWETQGYHTKHKNSGKGHLLFAMFI